MSLSRIYPYPRLALVVAGLVLLLLHALLEIPYPVQAAFFVLSVVLTGIPHGSLDHLVFRRHAELKGTFFSRLVFVGFYHKYLILYGLMWFWFPGIAAVLFVFLSAYHFGELDWIWIKGDAPLSFQILATVYGIVLLGGLFLFHFNETRYILGSLSGWQLPQAKFWEMLVQNRWMLLALANGLVLVLLMIHLYISQQPPGLFLPCLLQFLFLQGVLISLPIFLGFGFYFSFWHSLLTLSALRSFVWGKKGSWLLCIREGLSNSFVAILGIGGLLLWFRGEYDVAHMVSLMFMGIAVLTAPHMLVITRMFTVFSSKNLIQNGV